MSSFVPRLPPSFPFLSVKFVATMKAAILEDGYCTSYAYDLTCIQRAACAL